MTQMVKNLPAVQETRVQALLWEDPLEMGMITHFSILAWRIPWTEEPGGLQCMGSERVGRDELLTLSERRHVLSPPCSLPWTIRDQLPILCQEHSLIANRLWK